jgi:hypothetical protein
MVVLQVTNESDLESALEFISSKGIRFEKFYEPDDDMGYTSACTEPISGNRRNNFRKFSLWKL